MPATFDIVAKLWNLCNVLRDDGVQHSDYVTELTYLLFLKMAEETDSQSRIPAKYRWKSLTTREGTALLRHYRELLVKLGDAKNPRVQAIFANVQTSVRQQRHLHTLVTSIASLDWYSARQEGLGDLTQSLLAKAFRGDLVPQDPKDEPASALLDRLRKDRESAAGKPAKKAARKRTHSTVRKNQRKPLQES